MHVQLNVLVFSDQAGIRVECPHAGKIVKIHVKSGTRSPWALAMTIEGVAAGAAPPPPVFTAPVKTEVTPPPPSTRSASTTNGEKSAAPKTAPATAPAAGPQRPLVLLPRPRIIRVGSDSRHRQLPPLADSHENSGSISMKCPEAGLGDASIKTMFERS